MKNQRTIIYTVSAAIVSLMLVVAVGCETSNAPNNPGGSFHRTKSPMLERLERTYQEVIKSSRNEPQFIPLESLWNTLKAAGKAIAKWVSDAADVAYSDVEGFVEGAREGARVGVILEAAGEKGATATATVVGGVIGAAGASAKAYTELDDKKTGDNSGDGGSGGGNSSGGGNTGGNGGSGSGSGGGIVVNRPVISPYGDLLKPNSIDSIGWLHNEAVMYLLANKQSGSAEEFQRLLRKWAVEVQGYNPHVVDAVASPSVLAPILNNVSPKGQFDNFPARLRSKGLVVEADYFAALNNEIAYLYEQEYNVPMVLDLIRAYRDNVSNLNLSADRKASLVNQLTICMYSHALWDANAQK